MDKNLEEKIRNTPIVLGPIDYIDPIELETHCPFPDRECCDGCGNWDEDEDLCYLEVGL